ncbi:MAG: SCP2 sterol-binding domain-containing protein [Thermoplasmata archaeon]
MNADIEATLAGVVDRFNRHAQHNPAVAQELAGLERTIAVRLSDTEVYSVDLRGGRLENLRTSAPSKADVTIRTDPDTFRGLVSKEIGPMKAMVTGRLKLDGSLEDKLLFRKLL